MKLLHAFATLIALTGFVAQAAEPSPKAHIVRITAELTFDGKPVKIDDLIGCGIGYTGTPTSAPREVFRTNREGVFAPVPGGGIIGFRVTREFCYLNGAEWGAPFGDKRAPDDWTPVIEWFDHSDLREATAGLKYMSETALTAANGRLRITEPFRVTIPQHPPSPELIAEALAQAETRNLWPNEQVAEDSLARTRYLVLAGRNMPWMFRVAESEWRNPERAIIASETGTARTLPKPDFQALANWLDSYQGSGFVALPYPGKSGLPDVERMLILLQHGRRGELVDIYNLGIAKPNAPRFGLLLTERGTRARAAADPYYPNRFDSYVPFACRDGVMTTAPETPGLIYWYRDPCAWPKHFKSLSFFGRPMHGDFFPTNGRPVLDLDNGDLWLIDNT